MKRASLLLLLLLGLTPSWGADQPIGLGDLRIGDHAPEFALPGIDGKTHGLAEYQGARVLMVAFISNHCPDSHAAEGRIKAAVQEFSGKGFGMVAINPNNPDGLRVDELGYSKYNDGFEDMKKYAAEESFNFPYLYDGDTQATAKAYGCLATPHVFIFDEQRKLRYKGQFDDSRYEDPATVKSADARVAIEALLAGRPVPIEVTKPHGCSTKWMEKKSSVLAATQKWSKTPVDLEVIDSAGVGALRKNGTKKFRLFNVWATWCGPCVAEFPELVTAAHRFGMRDFELITISTDDAADHDKAKAFLEKQGAGLLEHLKPSLKAEGRKTNSYRYQGTRTEDLMNVLDPKWPGAIPHSVLVNPAGEVIWTHNGSVSGEELREAILAAMGRYYVPDQQ